MASVLAYRFGTVSPPKSARPLVRCQKLTIANATVIKQTKSIAVRGYNIRDAVGRPSSGHLFPWSY